MEERSDLTDEAALRSQQDYYRARAAEYDQWWHRQGRYDRGAELNAAWAAEGAEVVGALEDFRPGGRVLELACGTGLWTQWLAPHAAELTAVDGSPEMLEINAVRLGTGGGVRYCVADLFSWKPEGLFDVVFFGFWLSHVPPDRFAGFWEMVAGCLAPGGRVFLVDSRAERTSMAVDHTAPDLETGVQVRRLNDGREFQVFKFYHSADGLTRRLAELGWEFELKETERYFLHGWGRRRGG